MHKFPEAARQLVEVLQLRGEGPANRGGCPFSGAILDEGGGLPDLPKKKYPTSLVQPVTVQLSGPGRREKEH